MERVSMLFQIFPDLSLGCFFSFPDFSSRKSRLQSKFSISIPVSSVSGLYYFISFYNKLLFIHAPGTFWLNDTIFDFSSDISK
jgi:hypothetical protein